MKAKLVSYNLSKLLQWKKVAISRVLFGYTEYSNNSKYKYKRKGILETLPHIKVAKSVIIVRDKDYPKLIKSLKCRYKTYNINIPKAMLL